MEAETSPTTPVERLFYHILRSLQKEIECTGIQLLSESGQLLASVGADSGEVYETLPFSGMKMILGRHPRDLTGDEKNAIRAARDLVSVLASELLNPPEGSQVSDRRIMGQVRASHLIHSFLLLMKKYENRHALTDHYEKILNLSSRLLQEDRLDSVLKIIIQTMTDAVQGSSASLILVDPRTNELYFHTMIGETRTRLDRVKIPSGQGIAGWVVEKAAPELVRDVAADPRFFAGVDKATGQATKDMIVAPIFARERVIGVIEVVNSTAVDGFNSEDLEFLAIVARHTGLLVENARIKEELFHSRMELDRKVVELASLHEITGNLDHYAAGGEHYRTVFLRSLLRHLRFETGSILLPDETTTNLVESYSLVYRNGEIIEKTDHFLYRNIQDIIIWMKENREPYLFTGIGDRSATGGLARRFYEENPEMVESGPGLWIPVMDASTNNVIYIIALTDPPSDEQSQKGDILYYRSLMHIARLLERRIPQAPVIIQTKEMDEKEKIKQNSSGSARLVQRNIYLGIILPDRPDSSAKVTRRALNMGDIAYQEGDIFIIRFPGTGMRMLRDSRDGATEMVQEGCVTAVLHAGLHSDSGDPLNSTIHELILALQSARELEVSIALTKAYADELREDVALREIEWIPSYSTPGKHFPLYEQLITPESFQPFQDQWSMALQEYRRGAFSRTILLTRGILMGGGNDSVARRYLERCTEYMNHPPEGRWSAVFRWTEIGTPGNPASDSIYPNPSP